MIDVLLADEVVGGKIEKEELEKLCDPMNYMGCSQRMVDDVLQYKPG